MDNNRQVLWADGERMFCQELRSGVEGDCS